MKKILWPIILLVYFYACGEDQIIPDKITCSLLSPSADTLVCNNREIKLLVLTSETVREVKFYIDGILIGTVHSEPYALLWIPEDISAGSHQLTCTAVPVEGDNAEVSINIEFFLNLGDSFKGGKVFYLDDTGEHGLIASTTDLSLNNSSNFMWSSAEFLGATDASDGKSNTMIMANASSGADYAGYAFKNGFEQNGYIDWYIPAREEILLLKENRDLVGGFSTQPEEANYWSSTECCRIKAFATNLADLNDTITNKVDNRYRIRPIRRF
jgi:hypothetical protein